MKNIAFQLAALSLLLVLVACAPAETSLDPPALQPEASPTPAETAVAPSPTPVPIQPTETESPEPTATRLELELVPDIPTKSLPGEVIIPMPKAPPVDPPDDPYMLALIEKAKSDLAQRTGIDKNEILLHQAQLVTWPDASLGCPKPGMAYAQVLVDGYLIMLQAGLGIYNYHGGGYPDSDPFLCEGGPGTKIIVPPPAASLDQ